MAETRNSESEPKGAGESNPMAMGMAMAKKMMGHGAGPPEMMRKGMAQMSQGEAKTLMEQMIGVCSETLNAIREANALAVRATPELDKVFSDWLEALEEKAVDIVSKGETDGDALGVSEASTNYLLYCLATSDKVTLAVKART